MTGREGSGEWRRGGGRVGMDVVHVRGWDGCSACRHEIA